MQTFDAVLLISFGFVGVLTIFVLFTTGSILAVLALWLVVVLILLVLWYYDFVDLAAFAKNILGITITRTENKPTKTTTAPAPAQTVATTSRGPLVGSEVFHIGDSQFTYNDAAAVCAAYGATLATLEQVTEAYNNGAEWCGYGWSAGGFALYPTQKGTWQQLQGELDQKKRTACGRPGVNGGYFDPNTKFGVNCYGFKPAGKAALPAPPPGTDVKSFNAAVAKFKNALKSFTLDSWSRTEWSGYDSTLGGQVTNYGAQFQQAVGAAPTKEHFTEGDPTVIEASTVNNGISQTAGPIGIRGDQGPVGPAGPIGPQGPPGKNSTIAGPTGPAGTPGAPGARGADSTVAGPAGAVGAMGPAGAQGAQGPKGDKGDKGDPGERGPQGVPGAAGSSVGVVGPKGDTGPRGEKGEKGDMGAQGPAGAAGKDGAPGKNGIDGKNGVDGKNGAKGDMGPAGPKGDVGPVGPQGIAGPAGPAGIDGAHVVDSRPWDGQKNYGGAASQLPSWWYKNHPNSETMFGVNWDGYAVLKTITPWWDSTGGRVRQILVRNDRVWCRWSDGEKWSGFGDCANQYS